MEVDKRTAALPPLNLAKWMVDYERDIKRIGHKTLFWKGEFKVGCMYRFTHVKFLFAVSQVVVWGGDVVQEGGGQGETFLWQLKGSAEVTCGRGSGTLNGHSCTLILAGEK